LTIGVGREYSAAPLKLQNRAGCPDVAACSEVTGRLLAIDDGGSGVSQVGGWQGWTGWS